MKPRVTQHSVLVAVLLAASGCSGSATNASAGGSGGAESDSGGVAGSAGLAGNGGTADDAGAAGSTSTCRADPQCCPETQPEHGSWCDKLVTCNYVPSECTTPITIEAKCVDGIWSSPAIASCGLVPNAACDPLGHWSVTSNESLTYSKAESLAPPLAFVLHQQDNVVYTSLPKISVSTDGCTITGAASRSESVPGGSIQIYQNLELTLVGAGGATGTYTSSCWGECGWTETVAVMAVKAL
jgi:hypothetical protein